jgi:integrase
MKPDTKPRMKGGIRRRGDRSYQIFVSLGKDPATGKYRYLNQTVRGTREEAKAVRARLVDQISSGGFVPPSKMTLAEYLERWLKEHARPNLAPKTAEGYQLIVRRHLIPVLGRLTLSGLKPEHIQRYMSEKLSSGRADGRGGLSPRTVRHHYVTLHTALGHAVKMGLLGRNASDGVSPPRYQRHQWQSLSEYGVSSVLEAARQTQYYCLFYLALYTALRRSELLALRWCDVDLLLGRVHVTRSLHQLGGGEIVIRSPKSERSRRVVSLPPSAGEVLREHRAGQARQRAAVGNNLKEDDLVFSSPDGRPLRPDTVTHAWVKLVRRIGLDGTRLHDARHTHASLMLKQGVHPKIVQERLGHASIQLTLDTYSHVAPGLQEAAAAGFDRMISAGQDHEGITQRLLTNY